MKSPLVALSMVPLLLGGCAIATTPSPSTTPTTTADAGLTIAQQYKLYGDLLETYVTDEGLVDYESLQKNREPLDQLLAGMAQVSDETYGGWSDEEQIAFWVNAYNAFTLVSIIDEEPIKASIKDIPGVWRFREHAVQGRSITLDHMEHQILRVEFNEPRIHAALVCAAMSCPPLRTEPFLGTELDAQLDDQVEQFLAKADGLAIDQTEGVVSLSKIFDWFGGDWVATYAPENGFTGSEAQQAVLNFVGSYLPAETQAYLEQGDYRVDYFNYDWSLNGVERAN